MKRTFAALSVLAVTALSACSSPSAPVQDGPTGAAPSASEPAEPIPGFDIPAAFGDTIEFPSGVEVSVDAVSFAPPGEDVGVVGEGNQAIFSLTINNKSGGRIDASGMSWPRVSYGDNLESATLISNADITTLLDGDKKEDQFSRFIPVDAGDKVRVEVPAPDGGLPALFEGPVLNK